MTIRCPECLSHAVEPRHLGRKVGATVGTVAGVAKGATDALIGKDVDATLFKLASRAGVSLGTLAGAILAGLASGATDGAAGARAGHILDEHVLRGFRCRTCGAHFSYEPPAQDIPEQGI